MTVPAGFRVGGKLFIQVTWTNIVGAWQLGSSMALGALYNCTADVQSWGGNTASAGSGEAVVCAYYVLNVNSSTICGFAFNFVNYLGDSRATRLFVDVAYVPL